MIKMTRICLIKQKHSFNLVIH